MRRLNAVHEACAAARELPPDAARIRDDAMVELKAALREYDAFLDAAAHDLRNPLTAIKAQAQLLRRRIGRAAPSDVDPVSRVEDGLARIEVAVVQLSSLVDDLLERDDRDADASGPGTSS